jgi:MFS family permease
LPVPSAAWVERRLATLCDVTFRSPSRVDGLRAFRHRNYRLFYAGQGTSLIGTWMQQVAQAWLVLELTDEPLALGLVAAAQFTPVLVLGLFGGIVADALPKRRTLMIVQAAMMALAVTLFALTATGVVEVWMILVLALLLGVCNAFDMPVRQAFAAELVGRDDMPSAIGLSAAMFNASRIIGPAIGGLVIAAAGVKAAFLLNAVSFGAVLVAYGVMRPAELYPLARAPRPGSAAEVFRSLRDGLVYVRRTPVVLLGVTTVGLVSLFAMNFQVLVPILARDVLEVGAEGFGFLMAASGVGSLIASVWLAFGRGIRPRVIVGGAILIGASVAALGMTTSYPVAAALLFFAGMGGIAMAVSANMTNQLTAPDELRGRVIGVHTTIFLGSTPIGGIVAGMIASIAGVEAAFLVGGSVALVVGLAGAVWLRGALRSGVVVLSPTRPPAPTESAAPGGAPATAVPATGAPATAVTATGAPATDAASPPQGRIQ